MTINLRDLIADAILNAECENQPTCAGCMSASVVAELDRAGLVVVSAGDLQTIFVGSMHHPKKKRAAIARLWEAAFPPGKTFEVVLDEIAADRTGADAAPGAALPERKRG